jgi:hypothetical protein
LRARSFVILSVSETQGPQPECRTVEWLVPAGERTDCGRRKVAIRRGQASRLESPPRPLLPCRRRRAVPGAVVRCEERAAVSSKGPAHTVRPVAQATEHALASSSPCPSFFVSKRKTKTSVNSDERREVKWYELKLSVTFLVLRENRLTTCLRYGREEELIQERRLRSLHGCLCCRPMFLIGANLLCLCARPGAVRLHDVLAQPQTRAILLS